MSNIIAIVVRNNFSPLKKVGPSNRIAISKKEIFCDLDYNQSSLVQIDLSGPKVSSTPMEFSIENLVGGPDLLNFSHLLCNVRQIKFNSQITFYYRYVLLF